jgi:Protein of unknown function (DUF3224)
MFAESVRGEFVVTLTPQALFDLADQPLLARMSLSKTYSGALAATSKGEMLSARTAVKGSAGYVAIEIVTGTLNGRQGSFVLQHSSTMNSGAPTQSITVVPDSGTGQLLGLVGSMSIDIADGKHFYNFQFSLPA